MPHSRTLVVFLLATLCAAAAALLDFTSPSYYWQTEYRVRDAIARSGRTTPPNPFGTCRSMDPLSRVKSRVPVLKLKNVSAPTRVRVLS